MPLGVSEPIPSRLLISRNPSHIRDLKHQDGRWRRRRHIRVKAGARPASRSTRLCMLSPGEVLWEFLGGDVALGPWNP